MIPIRKHVALGLTGSLIILSAIFFTQGQNSPFVTSTPSTQVGTVGTIPHTTDIEANVSDDEQPLGSAPASLIIDAREIAREVLREIRELDPSEYDDMEWEDEPEQDAQQD